MSPATTQTRGQGLGRTAGPVPVRDRADGNRNDGTLHGTGLSTYRWVLERTIGCHMRSGLRKTFAVLDDSSRDPVAASDDESPGVRSVMQSKVIVVDDFYPDPDAIRALALQSKFADINPVPIDHPGHASRLSIEASSLRPRFADLVGGEVRAGKAMLSWGGFRYITAESGSRARIHTDSRANDWAAMVYLTPDPPMGVGTGFYRHKRTGLDTPPTDRQARALGFCDASEFDIRVTSRDKADPSKWELIDQVGPAYNRLVLFRGSELYHAPLGGCGDSPETARLTHNFFFTVIPEPGTAAYPVP